MTEKIILKGISASGGVAEGVVRVVQDQSDTERFNDGEVLVTKMTEPSMVMMMNRASAIVTDHGGITSHPAIVSRELGIPCVVNTKLATKVLCDGMHVRVDGIEGTVIEIP